MQRATVPSAAVGRLHRVRGLDVTPPVHQSSTKCRESRSAFQRRPPPHAPPPRSPRCGGRGARGGGDQEGSLERPTYHGLAGEDLLGDHAGQTAEQVPAGIDDDLLRNEFGAWGGARGGRRAVGGEGSGGGGGGGAGEAPWEAPAGRRAPRFQRCRHASSSVHSSRPHLHHFGSVSSVNGQVRKRASQARDARLERLLRGASPAPVGDIVGDHARAREARGGRAGERARGERPPLSPRALSPALFPTKKQIKSGVRQGAAPFAVRFASRSPPLAFPIVSCAGALSSVDLRAFASNHVPPHEVLQVRQADVARLRSPHRRRPRRRARRGALPLQTRHAGGV